VKVLETQELKEMIILMIFREKLKKNQLVQDLEGSTSLRSYKNRLRIISSHCNLLTKRFRVKDNRYF